MKKRLAVVTTHPIQYHSPWFRGLHESPHLDVHVYYGHRAGGADQASAGFGVEFEWDTPMLDGYPHTFLRNAARRPSPTTFMGIDTPEVPNELARGGFDGVLVNGWHYKGAWQAVTACWRRSIPVMVRSDSHLHTPRSRIKSAAKWLPYRGFIPRFDGCLAVGTWARDYFLHYGAAKERVFILPHVLDVGKFEAASRDFERRRLELRREWDLEENAVVFLFAGKFIEKKRPLDFVRAVERASRLRPGLMGLLAGDGPLRAECQSLARERGLPVRFTGFLNQSRIAAAYAAADALVLPSDGRETWGLVVNEAMACGRPCLVSDQVGCAPDMVSPGQTGFIFPMGDVEALAELMARHSDAGFLRRLGEAARSVSRRYNVEAAVDCTVAAVRSVC